MVSIHFLSAGLWTGSVAFVAGADLPAARDGSLSPEALDHLTGRLVRLTRLNALVMLLTGGYVAGTRYTGETLTGSGRGHFVVTIVVLWFALVEVVLLLDGGLLAGGFPRVELPFPSTGVGLVLRSGQG